MRLLPVLMAVSSALGAVLVDFQSGRGDDPSVLGLRNLETKRGTMIPDNIPELFIKTGKDPKGVAAAHFHKKQGMLRAEYHSLNKATKKDTTYAIRYEFMLGAIEQSLSIWQFKEYLTDNAEAGGANVPLALKFSRNNLQLQYQPKWDAPRQILWQTTPQINTRYRVDFLINTRYRVDFLINTSTPGWIQFAWDGQLQKLGPKGETRFAATTFPGRSDPKFGAYLADTVDVDIVLNCNRHPAAPLNRYLRHQSNQLSVGTSAAPPMATQIPDTNPPVAITNNCIDSKVLAIHTKEVKPAMAEITEPCEKTEEGLFSTTYISPDVVSLLPENYSLRPLRRSDYKNGFLDVLSVLTKVGEFTTELWNERYDWMAKRNDEYYVLVICDGTGRVVGTGSLIVERKFIHSAGMVGHIEDIAIESGQQGKKLGLRMIHALDYVAKEAGCYKSILDCSEANEGFYLKCGFKRAGLEMAHYY
ncbi:uncharacterized protein GIQ15_00888 [Arthroderma uncinatum]|uniref:uncharacterized protein n=1 Tax=Arthroderma uncinatum TaxID=74035 RepID=UPI00144A8362|nr:uncharacterized protein GIQ15_00888 [Arthroderma uncinatum]KAF3491371.1 hypothetical protein GIQ15_00888 [Arthroderma uncinatum]